jgi:NAD(P)-dependent dehydrogenase (short-subunit alcohol dehydrogenase family)
MNPNSFPPGRVAGKVALVTGAASGIGRAAALLLAREGAKVLAADIDEPGAASAVGEITAAGGVAQARRLDVTSEADWQAAVAWLEQSWGGLHVLVNSAGIAVVAPVAEMTPEQWRRVLAVNLDGIFLGTRAAIPAMRRSGRGSIVNIASASGLKAAPGAGAYCASKAGVLMFTKVAALECGQHGDHIRVNAIAPGGVKTPIWGKVPGMEAMMASEAWNAPPDVVPGKRFALPEEIAQAVLFLASDEASYVTAAVLAMDAGYSA